MKKLLLYILSALCAVFAASAQLLDSDALHIYKDGKITHKLPFYYVDSIVHSRMDLDMVEQPDIVVQEFYTVDSIYRIPVASIDSIVVYTPSALNTEAARKKYEDAMAAIKQQVESGAITTNQQLVDAAMKQPGYAYYEEKGGMYYVYFEGGLRICSDFDGLSVPIYSDEELDLSDLDKLLDEIDSELGASNGRSLKLPSRSGIATNFCPVKPTYKILLWSPWLSKSGCESNNLIYVREICNSINAHDMTSGFKIAIDEAIGPEVSLSSMKEFGNYDMVIVNCHGTTQGELAFPEAVIDEYYGLVDYVGGMLSKNIHEDGASYSLSISELAKYLPRGSLSHTVIYTLQCYGLTDKSANQAFMRAHGGAADYFGATERVTAVKALENFKKYLINLYNGAISDDAWGEVAMRPYHIPAGVDACTKKEYGEIKGSYGHVVLTRQRFCFPRQEAIEAKDGRDPGAHFQAPPGVIMSALEGNDNYQIGIELTREGSGEKQYIRLTPDNILPDYQKKDYEGIIEAYDFYLNPSGLKEGKYTYRSYLTTTTPTGKTSITPLSAAKSIDLANTSFSSNTKEVTIEEYKEMYLAYHTTRDFTKPVSYGFGLNKKNIEFIHATCVSDPSVEAQISSYGGLTAKIISAGDYLFKIEYKANVNEKSFIELADAQLIGGWITTDSVMIKGGAMTSIVSGNGPTSELDSILNGKLLIAPSTIVGIDVIQGKIPLSSIETIMLDESNKVSEIYLQGNSTLREVNIHNCDSIRDDAFSGCDALDKVFFPTCRAIGKGAFFCSSVKSIDLPNCKILNGDGYPFAYCMDLKNINLPNCTVITSPSHGWGCFSACTSLDSLYLPNCSFVGARAFNDCINLININLPKCEDIALSSFAGCTSLTTVSMPECINVGPYAFDGCTSMHKIYLPKCATVDEYAFKNCTSLEIVDLPKCIKLMKFAFEGVKSLRMVSIPSCITIEGGVFRYCASLSDIVLPEGLISIGSDAFYDCPMKHPVIPSTVTELGASVWTKAVTVKCYPKNVPQWIRGYRPANYDAQYYVPASSLEAYRSAWGNWRDKLDENGRPILDSQGNRIRVCINVFPL